ncbi:OLC1v1012436C1 [Oldenlandia corymbosa var. corymbosa]|uniref:OLC1v1012436C1 n=1 Tax=Oldenlandia corymbosa var. corymbosa TaxID=529605 RepID=A0AAV1DW55_OLDCO|nr:OLC1v1012436C1 [Oldenlandia corymbosa var. corymbosa]
MLVEGSNPAIQINSRALQQHLFALLRSCKSIKHLTQIHSQIITNGLTQKSFILVKLLSFYISSGHLHNATRVFNQVRNPSTNIWNQIIKGYGLSQEPHKAVEFFSAMGKSEALPDGYTFSYVICGCTKGVLLSEGRMVHGKVLKHGFCSNVFVQTNLLNFYSCSGGDNGIRNTRFLFDEMTDRNVVTWNSLLSGYIRCGDVDGARQVFDEMPERNVVSWTTMIDGYATNGRFRQALVLFRRMCRSCVDFDQVTLVVVLSACAELGDLNTGRWIHLLGLKFSSDKGQPKLISFDNALIHMYASCGAIDEAHRVFRETHCKTTVSWTSMIMGFAKQGLGEEAIRLFQEMERLTDDNIKPDEVTFLGVMSACSHTGNVDKGWHYFWSMSQTWGIEPRIEHYGCMVDILCRAGLFDEALSLVASMPIKPNDVIWGALLGGCRIHGNMELCSHVARLFSLEIEPEKVGGYIMLMSNLYSAAKRWQDAHFVKQRIAETGARKPSGRSWVQMDEILHDFVVND